MRDKSSKPLVRPWVFIAIPIMVVLVAVRFYHGPFLYQDVSLLNAVADDDRETVIALLEGGADVRMQDIVGISVLHQTKNVAMAELLIEWGADLNAQDKDGNTPLHEALTSEHRELLEVLIKQGANLNVLNNRGDTPLEMSVQLEDFAEMIRKRGGKIGDELREIRRKNENRMP